MGKEEDFAWVKDNLSVKADLNPVGLWLADGPGYKELEAGLGRPLCLTVKAPQVTFMCRHK